MPKESPSKTVSEAEWRRLPELFDKRNRGERLKDEEVGLIARAFWEDSDRVRQIKYQSVERTLTK